MRVIFYLTYLFLNKNIDKTKKKPLQQVIVTWNLSCKLFLLFKIKTIFKIKKKTFNITNIGIDFLIYCENKFFLTIETEIHSLRTVILFHLNTKIKLLKTLG